MLDPSNISEALRSRITLLVPSRPGLQFDDLPFATTNVFNTDVFREPGFNPVKPRIPKSSDVASLLSTKSNSISGSSHGSMSRDMSVKSTRPIYPTTVLVNKDGERLDGKLGAIDSGALERMKERLKRERLCHSFSLKGNCTNRRCQATHDHTMSREEVIALAKITRHTTPCTHGVDCRSAVCMYGHTCPHTPCHKGTDCAFRVFHGKDLRQVRSLEGKHDSRAQKDYSRKYEHELRVLDAEPLLEFDKGQAPFGPDRYPVLTPSNVLVIEKPVPPRIPATLTPQEA